MFNKTLIVGKRFPICLVYNSLNPNITIEVASFSTVLNKYSLPPDLDEHFDFNKVTLSNIFKISQIHIRA